MTVMMMKCVLEVENLESLNVKKVIRFYDYTCDIHTCDCRAEQKPVISYIFKLLLFICYLEG